jgi:hypothetical protein
MPRSAHTEEQMVAVLRQGEAGEKVADICRKVGISVGTTTRGENNMPVWALASYASCANCETSGLHSATHEP